ncbi:uncharacterized protein LOC134191355 [Corticium candelabrum]|uniref:uncharacterized protein LOC134191355 n=1 Tax=Corticium candelabrum TaxID=121492 RepID=UPI002E268C53|nr:uncharacterized protein LOC134191355 [Corticium candelabrum]
MRGYVTDFRWKRLVIVKVSNRFNLSTALIQNKDGRKKLTRVIKKNVSGSYLEIGLEVGLKKDRIDELANPQPTGHAKLQAILCEIQQDEGEERMLRKVLEACEYLHIMGDIRDDLAKENV